VLNSGNESDRGQGRTFSSTGFCFCRGQKAFASPSTQQVSFLLCPPPFAKAKNKEETKSLTMIELMMMVMNVMGRRADRTSQRAQRRRPLSALQDVANGE
jgi:hypothetical protein